MRRTSDSIVNTYFHAYSNCIRDQRSRHLARIPTVPGTGLAFATRLQSAVHSHRTHRPGHFCLFLWTFRVSRHCWTTNFEPSLSARHWISRRHYRRCSLVMQFSSLCNLDSSESYRSRCAVHRQRRTPHTFVRAYEMTLIDTTNWIKIDDFCFRQTFAHQLNQHIPIFDLKVSPFCRYPCKQRTRNLSTISSAFFFDLSLVFVDIWLADIWVLNTKINEYKNKVWGYVLFNLFELELYV